MGPELLKCELTPEGNPGRMRTAELVAFMERMFDVPSGSVMGRDRHRRAAACRHAVWAELWDRGWSYPRNRALGGSRSQYGYGGSERGKKTIMNGALRMSEQEMKDLWDRMCNEHETICRRVRSPRRGGRDRDVRAGGVERAQWHAGRP